MMEITESSTAFEKSEPAAESPGIPKSTNSSVSSESSPETSTKTSASSDIIEIRKRVKNEQGESSSSLTISSEVSEFSDSSEIPSESLAPSEISDLLVGGSLTTTPISSHSTTTSRSGSPEMPRKYDKPVHVVSKFEEIICLICEINLKICGSSYTHIFRGQKRGNPCSSLPERISFFIGAREELKPSDVGSSYMCAQCQRNLQKAELLEKQVNQIRDTFANSFSSTSMCYRLKKRRVALNQPQSSVEVKQLQIRIKELEQERHALRLRLESLEAEYDNTVKELQDDVSQLRQSLHEQQQQLTAGDKDKVNIIRELTQQNERLTDQVQRDADMEGQLVSEVQGLRTQISLRMSMPDQIDQLEALHMKINELNEKKSEVERKIVVLTEERESYACSLDESQDRILMLEKQKLEQELHIRTQGREIYELQEVNHQLQVQVDNLSQRSSYSNIGPPSQTLFNELSSLSIDSEKDAVVPTLESESLTNLSSQSMMMMDMTFEDDIECDDECSPIPMANSTMSNDPALTQVKEYSKFSDELLSEVIEVYNHIRKLCTKLRTKSYSGGTSDSVFEDDHQKTCNSIDDLRPGQLRTILQELQQLIHNQFYTGKHKETWARLSLNGDIRKFIKFFDVMEGSKATGGEPIDGEEIKKVTLMAEQIHDLHLELNGVRTHVAGLHADLQVREQQLQQKNTEMSQRNNKIDAQQAELYKLRAQCDILEDKSIGNISRDEVLEQARHDRNSAMEMKVQLEKELYRTKNEVMSLNNQLMAAIHQKVMVSQQRDQWQNDMEDLIDIQMRKRLIQENRNELAEERMKETKVKRTSSFFSRVKH